MIQLIDLMVKVIKSEFFIVRNLAVTTIVVLKQCVSILIVLIPLIIDGILAKGELD